MLRKLFIIVCLLLSNNLYSSSVNFQKDLNDLVAIGFAPEYPVAGEPFEMIIELRTDLTSPNPVRLLVEARIEGQLVALTKTTSTTWVARIEGLEADEYDLRVNVYLENIQLADQLRAAITVLDIQILNLTSDIQYERDPDLRAQLIQERLTLQNQRNTLRQNLNQLRKFLGRVDEVIWVE